MFNLCLIFFLIFLNISKAARQVSALDASLNNIRNPNVAVGGDVTNKEIVKMNQATNDEKYFNQLISHVDRVGNYSQRYYNSLDNYREGGPMIVYIGGEGKLSDRALKNGLAADLAKDLGASIYSLEHRYYGKSQPFLNWSVSNLKYLSAYEALQDLRTFIQAFRLPNQKVIVIGGSYAGNLAAWARKLFPDLVFASLASSAPVLAKKDFYEYDQVVYRSLGNECASLVAEFSQQLDNILDLNNRAEINNIKELFTCSEVKDDTLFVSVLSDMIATAVQYNRENIPFNVKTVCSGLSKGLPFQKQLEHLANATKIYFKTQNKSCYDLTFLDEVRDINISEDKANRQWTYQTCREFGYYQSAPPLPSPSTRSRRLTYEWITQFSCSSQNFETFIGPPNTEFTNNFYGGNQRISRVIYTNGLLDPWSYLSILPDMGKMELETSENLILIIPSGSHTQDLLPNTKLDPNDLLDARKRIHNKLKSWLNEV